MAQHSFASCAELSQRTISVGDTALFDGVAFSDQADALHAYGSKLVDLAEIVITNADSVAGHALALGIADACSGRLTMADEAGSVVARIVPPDDRVEPSPLPVDPRPSSYPADFALAQQTSLANDYRLAVADARTGPMPTLPITVVVPLYNRREMMSRTLACLTHQTYPLELIEVLIADDGSSDDPLSALGDFEPFFGSVNFIRQQDLGYRLSEVRNLGIRAASNEHVILLDCDMAPVPRLVELFARHLAVLPTAVFCGHRRYVDANDVSIDSVVADPTTMLCLPDIETANEQVREEGEVGPTVDWRMPIYAATNKLAHERHPFLAVCGGNIAFHRSVFREVGGFDESFIAWGAEDAEWGYRVWNRGHQIVPIIDACGLHQEPVGGRNETDREAGRATTHDLLVEKCPVRYRPARSTRSYSVPLVSIYIPAYNAAGTLSTAIESALDQTIRDLEVCVVDDGSTDGTDALLANRYGDNPRVRWLRQENGGIGAASNAAVRLCNGPFIGQLDSDDRLKPTAVEELLPVLRSDPRIGVAYSSSELIDPTGRRIGDAYEVPEFNRYALMIGMIVHHFRLFRARDWYRTAGFAEDMKNAVDYDMFLKLDEVTRTVHLPKQLYQYRMHQSSTSKKHRTAQYENHMVAVHRAMRRRGIDVEWKTESTDPNDARRFKYVRRSEADQADVPIAFGSLQAVRLLARFTSGPREVETVLQKNFPSWQFEITASNGETQALSPLLSPSRVRQSLDQLKKQFEQLDANLKVVSQ